VLNIIRVMLVDDHEIVRAGFHRLLDSAEGITVVCEASSGDEAYHQYQKYTPELVVMDLSMPPGAGGLDAIQRIRAVDPQAKIIALTVQESEPYPWRVMKAGAKGYLTKRCAPEELIEAVRQVSEGKEFIAEQIKPQLNGDHSGGSILNALTRRELQIFTQLATGQSPLEIAEAMFISQKTVHAHRSNIMNKLELEKTSDIIHMGIRHGIVEA
jgi:two-component system invasion response regulator UvrY